MLSFWSISLNYKIVFASIFLSTILVGCARPSADDAYAAPHYQSQANTATVESVEVSDEELFYSLLMNEYSHWEGTRYRFGGTTERGLDCSSLVQHIYKNSFKMKLPRTTTWQVKKGVFIARNALKVADLVFFKTGINSRHVGIYVGDNQFLHVSESKGVKISSLDNVYWKRKYWQARRILN